MHPTSPPSCSDAVGDYYEDQVEHEWETLTGLCIGSAMVMGTSYILYVAQSPWGFW